jgi:hypothetical protein
MRFSSRSAGLHFMLLRILASATLSAVAMLAMPFPAAGAGCLQDGELPRCAAGSHLCDAGSGPGSGKCQWHSATASCDCIPQSTAGYNLNSSTAAAKVHPADSTDVGVTVTPVHGYKQDVTLSCRVAGSPGSHDVAPPSCAFQPSRIPSGSGRSTLTISTSAQTSADHYSIEVDAVDALGRGPQNAPATFELDVLLNGGPITYMQVVTPALATLNPQCPATPSGSLGSLNFGVVNLILTFEGNTANVVPFLLLPRPGRRVPGWENIVGQASVEVQDFFTKAVLAKADFLPEAGIFVSADNGNSAVGFGSFGKLPQDPGFPGEPVYPYGLVAVGIGEYDLKHSIDTSSIPGANAMSCIASGPASATTGCAAPKPLATNAGDLLITGSNPTSIFCHGNGFFKATPTPYPLTVTPLAPDGIVPGSSATSTVTVGPLAGYTADVTLSCSVTGGGAPAPTCSLQPNVVRFGSGNSTLTVSTSARTPLASYAVEVTGADINGLAPENGPRTLLLSVNNDAVVGETGGGGEVALATLAVLLTLWSVVRIVRRRAGREP